MKYVRLGSSGLKITEMTFGSALTIGTENKEVSYAEELISTAWEMGIRSFDTSNNYGFGNAEKLLGIGLKKFPRNEFVVSTKGSWPVGETPYHRGLSRKHIQWSIDESLKRLNMEYIDIYYAHRYDPETSMEEIVRTFNDLIRSGKILYWATSEWPINALKECHEECDKFGLEKPIAEQFIYSYAVRKAEVNGVRDFCVKNNIGMLGFSPLCQGFLTGKYKSGIPKDSRISKSSILNYDKTVNFYNQNREEIDHFINLCEKYGADYTAVAFQWCLRQKIMPVFGASNSEQLVYNVKAIENDVAKEIWEEL